MFLLWRSNASDIFTLTVPMAAAEWRICGPTLCHARIRLSCNGSPYQAVDSIVIFSDSFHLVMRPSNDQRSVEFAIVEGQATENQTPTIILAVCVVPSANRVCTTRVKSKRRRSSLDWAHSHSASCPSTPRGRQYEPFAPSDHEAFREAIALKDEMRQPRLHQSPTSLSADFEWVLKPPMFGLMAWEIF